MLLLLSACFVSPVKDVQAELVEGMPTVVRVTWTGSSGAVEYGLEDQLGLWTPDGEGEALLLGLPPDSEVQFKVWPGREKASDLYSIRTGSLPEGTPTTEHEGDWDEGFVLTTALGAINGPLILSPGGQVSWFLEDHSGMLSYRARLARDGSGILYNRGDISGEPSEDSEIVHVGWDGQVLERVPIPRLAHDFVELEDGTLVAMTVDELELGEETLRIDSLVEVAPSGQPQTIWSSPDCFPVEELDEGFANALDLSEDEDELLLGFRTWSSIVQIDRATGDCDWVLGRTEATHSVDEPFLGQHQFQVLPEGLLVFDNEGLSGSRSRAIEYDFLVDEPADARATWSYEPQPETHTFVLGDAHRAATGRTFVTFSAGGQLDIVDAQGELQARTTTDLGVALGFSQVVAELHTGRPL